MSMIPTVFEMRDAAKEFYSPELPYHNWDHAMDAVRDAEAFNSRLQRRTGRIVGGGALMVAMAWHDTGYHEDQVSMGFETKEHYSAHLSRAYLESVQASEEFIVQIEAGILATRHGVERSTDLELLAHRADISNIGDNFQRFVMSNLKLRREHEALTGEKVPWDEWVARTQAYVDFLVDESRRELPLLGESIGSFGSFDTRARENMARLANTPEPGSMAKA